MYTHAVGIKKKEHSSIGVYVYCSINVCYTERLIRVRNTCTSRIPLGRVDAKWRKTAVDNNDFDTHTAGWWSNNRQYDETRCSVRTCMGCFVTLGDVTFFVRSRNMRSLVRLTTDERTQIANTTRRLIFSRVFRIHPTIMTPRHRT